MSVRLFKCRGCVDAYALRTDAYRHLLNNSKCLYAYSHVYGDDVVSPIATLIREFGEVPPKITARHKKSGFIFSGRLIEIYFDTVPNKDGTHDASYTIDCLNWDALIHIGADNYEFSEVRFERIDLTSKV